MHDCMAPLLVLSHGAGLSLSGVLVCLPACLQNLLNSLDAAVAEVGSTHCQRFARYIR